MQDSCGRVVEGNAAAQEWWGENVSMIGSTACDFPRIDLDGQTITEGPCEEALRTGRNAAKVQGTEIEPGRFVWTSSTAVPIDGPRRSRWVLHYWQDVTELVNARAPLPTLNALRVC